jgi:hypothetical protein
MQRKTYCLTFWLSRKSILLRAQRINFKLSVPNKNKPKHPGIQYLLKWKPLNCCLYIHVAIRIIINAVQCQASLNDMIGCKSHAGHQIDWMRELKIKMQTSTWPQNFTVVNHTILKQIQKIEILYMQRGQQIWPRPFRQFFLFALFCLILHTANTWKSTNFLTKNT